MLCHANYHNFSCVYPTIIEYTDKLTGGLISELGPSWHKWSMKITQYQKWRLHEWVGQLDWILYKAGINVEI